MPRKPMPVDLLLVKGKKHITKQEIENRRQAEQQLKPKADKVNMPEWLDEVAQVEWKRIVNELIDLGLMTNVDVSALAIYCDSFSKYIQATEALQRTGLTMEYTNKSGATNLVPSPYVNIQNKYADIIKKFLNEFGLTPSSRIKMVLPKEEIKELTEEEKMFPDV